MPEIKKKNYLDDINSSLNLQKKTLVNLNTG